MLAWKLFQREPVKLAPVAHLRASMLDHTTPEFEYRAHTRERLSFAEIEAAYLKDALVFRGVNKKSRDVFKSWHVFDKDADKGAVAKLQAFARRVGLKRVLTNALSDALLYGDAFIEKVYDGDTAPNEAEPSTKRLKALSLVNPKTMRPIRDTQPGSPSLGEVIGYEQQVDSVRLRFHPSRFIHLQPYNIGDDERGVGAVEAAYTIIVAKIKGDKALGDILTWHAKGYFALKIQDATDEELVKGYEMVKKAREQGVNFFVGSDRHDYDIKPGAQVNPTPFLDEFHTDIAAALDMPKDLLIGASAGAITGSETNLRDYYEDCAAFRDLYFSAVVEELYAAELGVDVADLSARPVWPPLFVNEQAEADTRFKTAQAYSIAYRDQAITKNEYRQALGLDPVDGGDEFHAPPEPLLTEPGTGADADGFAATAATWTEYAGEPGHA